MAYNEEANIANAIKAVLGQQLLSGDIAELIVVASGCTDRTIDIVTALAREDTRVRLIVQERRAGKASAINLFIGAAQSPILLMVSADTLVRSGTITALLQHFRDPAVGMVGGHPIPVNDGETFLGYAVHLLWRLHDQIARESPKLGEIVAFRNVVPSIPSDTAVDEISIQALMAQLGYRLVYEPRAIVYNRGPTTVRDFLRQRRRISAGHHRIAKQQRYAASTMSIRRISRALLRSELFTVLRALRTPLWTVGTVALEAMGRALGYYDFLRRQPHHIWATATTTKGDIAEGVDVQVEQNVLVFHLVDFTPDQLELGVRVTHSLLQQVARHIKARLRPSATVSEQNNGTIIAFVPGDRGEAENIAQLLVQDLAAGALDNHHRDSPSIKIACAIITFPQIGSPLTRSIPALAS